MTRDKRGYPILKEEKRTVLVMGTLDTKSQEIKYLRDRILKSGLNVIVLDNGVLGEPQGIRPDISARETAQAAGVTLDEIRRKSSRGEAIDEMIKGCKVLVRKLCGEGRIQRAISFGGAEGGIMAARAMQILPPGFPTDVTEYDLGMAGKIHLPGMFTFQPNTPGRMIKILSLLG